MSVRKFGVNFFLAANFPAAAAASAGASKGRRRLLFRGKAHSTAKPGSGYLPSMVKRLSIQTRGQGLHEITDEVRAALADCRVESGLCTIFIQHTSASLVIQENADPSARHDLENWLNRLVPENDPSFTHNDEGPDDMPSHIKAALTATSLAIPIIDGRLALGRWQGIFLWEHRRKGSERKLVIHAE